MVLRVDCRNQIYLHFLFLPLKVSYALLLWKHSTNTAMMFKIICVKASRIEYQQLDVTLVTCISHTLSEDVLVKHLFSLQSLDQPIFWLKELSHTEAAHSPHSLHRRKAPSITASNASPLCHPCLYYTYSSSFQHPCAQFF